MTDVRRAEPWKNARLLTRESWSLPSWTKEDNLEEEAPGCSLPGRGQDCWPKGGVEANPICGQLR